jgi:hypothetical protein
MMPMAVKNCFIIHGAFYENVSKKFPDWPPGAKTANGTALCH